MVGELDGARCPIQVDIGFGDAVTPAPEMVSYPVIIKGFDPPKLRVYPRYTVVAEKFEALCLLGMANSRMKDYFDLWILCQHAEFDGAVLAHALEATFERRQTPLPQRTPLGLTQAFAEDNNKQTQWNAFHRKNGLIAEPLPDIVDALVSFLMPVTETARQENRFPSYWHPGGPWFQND